MKNDPAFPIREAKEKDVSEICALAAELCNPAFHWPKEKLRGQLRDSKTKTYVGQEAARGQRILAFVCLMDLGLAVEIPVLGTRKDSQHHGYMKQLLQRIFAAHYDSRELWLEVHENNLAARNLYRTLAFVESGKRPDYYQDGCAAILCNRFPR